MSSNRSFLELLDLVRRKQQRTDAGRRLEPCWECVRYNSRLAHCTTADCQFTAIPAQFLPKQCSVCMNFNPQTEVCSLGRCEFRPYQLRPEQLRTMWEASPDHRPYIGIEAIKRDWEASQKERAAETESAEESPALRRRPTWSWIGLAGSYFGRAVGWLLRQPFRPFWELMR